jgi:hypothetical protein
MKIGDLGDDVDEMYTIGSNRPREWHHHVSSVTTGCCISWHQDSAPLCLLAIRGKLEHV